MADNTWSAVGADNWSTDAAWSLGHKPQAGEDVIFDATSVQNCSVDGSTELLGSLTFAEAYTGTVSHTSGNSLKSSGTVHFSSAMTYTAGSGLVQITAAAPCTITYNGQVIGQMQFQASAHAVTLVDALTCAGIATPGTVNQNGQTISVVAAIILDSAAGSVFDGTIISASYINCYVTVTGTFQPATKLYLQAAPDVSGATAQLAADGLIQAQASKTIGRIIAPVGAWEIKATGGNVLTIGSYTATEWDGSTLTSETGGVSADIVAPAGMVVSGMTVTDINNGGAEIDASDGTNTDGGGNTGWNFTGGGATGSSVARQKSSTSVGIGIGV